MDLPLLHPKPPKLSTVFVGLEPGELRADTVPKVGGCGCGGGRGEDCACGGGGGCDGDCAFGCSATNKHPHKTSRGAENARRIGKYTSDIGACPILSKRPATPQLPRMGPTITRPGHLLPREEPSRRAPPPPQESSAASSSKGGRYFNLREGAKLVGSASLHPSKIPKECLQRIRLAQTLQAPNPLAYATYGNAWWSGRDTTSLTNLQWAQIIHDVNAYCSSVARNSGTALSSPNGQQCGQWVVGMWQTGVGFCEPLCELRPCTGDYADPEGTCTCREVTDSGWTVKCYTTLGLPWRWDNWAQCLLREHSNGDVDCACTIRCIHPNTGVTHNLFVPDANPCPD